MFNRLLVGFFAHRIDGVEPRIVELADPIHIVGMSMQTNITRIYSDLPALGRRYREHKQRHPIPNPREPWAFAAVSKDFDPETGAMTYIMGDVVSEMSETEGLVAFDIPAITYAVFPVRPKSRFGWAFAIPDAKRYAYNVWLPNSRYEPAGAIDDFEYHDERSTRKKNPEIDLYVAIQTRQLP
jgi:predicted transcriptional regulator YdeE